MGTHTMKKKVIVCLAVLGLTVAAVAAPQDGRKLVWSDEFGGSSLDATKWKFHARPATLPSRRCCRAAFRRGTKWRSGTGIWRCGRVCRSGMARGRASG